MSRKPTYEELEEQLMVFKRNDFERFEQLIKNSFDMLVLLDDKGVQQYVSESCKRILGFKPEELIDIPVIELMIHPEDQVKIANAFKNIITDGINTGTQYRHRHKKGGWVYLEAVGTNQLKNPLVKSIVLNVRDITEHKKKELQLIESQSRLTEANKAKDRFFSIIGHDLKGPFNSIVGFSDVLLDQVDNEDYEGIETYAKIIFDSSQRAMSLLDNLLEWSRTQSGKIEYKPESIELVSLSSEVIDLMKDCARNKQISIVNNLPQELQVIGDKSMVKTILRNLISNAIKFTNESGQIAISANKLGDRWLFEVADNGIGMKKENLERLFKIDCSYSSLGTNDELGTGLGLLLCKEFVELHGGTIEVESEVGKGSCFRFTIPLIK